MVDAKIYFTVDGFEASLSGHAGFAPKGQDIVCAGVSALVMSLADTVENAIKLSDIGALEIKAADGEFYIHVGGISSAELYNDLNAYFHMFRLGLEKIQQEYPDYIKVSMFVQPLEDEYNDTSEQTMTKERKEAK